MGHIWAKHLGHIWLQSECSLTFTSRQMFTVQKICFSPEGRLRPTTNPGRVLSNLDVAHKRSGAAADSS